MDFINGISNTYWTTNTALDGRVFDGPILTTVSRSSTSCVIACLTVDSCVFVTYNNGTGVCRGHDGYLSLKNVSTSNPGTVVLQLRKSRMLLTTYNELS